MIIEVAPRYFEQFAELVHRVAASTDEGEDKIKILDVSSVLRYSHVLKVEKHFLGS